MEWLRIGEVARRTGLTHRTLRHYHDLGLLVPSGRSGGDYRLYSRDDLERLLAIQHLKSLGMGLEEIGRALDDPGFDAAGALERHAELVGRRIAAEQQLLARLRRLQRAAVAGWDEVLDVIALSERLRHPEAGVRFRAALDAPGAAPLGDLVDVLRTEPEAGVREVVTWAIVQHGPEAVRAMLAGLDDPDAGVRLHSAHALGKLADPASAGPLARLLGDPDEDGAVAAKAAHALGRIGGRAAVHALAGALGRGDHALRSAVVVALGVVDGGGHDVADAVARALASPDARTRADAAEALGMREDPASVPALAGVVGDPEEDVRVAALMALGAIGTPDAHAAVATASDAPGLTGLLARRLTPDAGDVSPAPSDAP